MKIINLEQGTKEWLSWRKTVITATDCPAIMGSSPWVTPYKCWQKKLGLIEENKCNAAMERGIRLEPKARDQFMNHYGIEMKPRVVESTEYDFLGASLDGISSVGNYILEIKCGGVKLHGMASHGQIPEYYMHQMQHQLFVTRAEKCFYYSFDGENGICIEVFPDPGFSEKFIPLARDFWKGVAFLEAPSLQKSDYKDMTDNLDWYECSNLYRSTVASIKSLEEKKDFIRKRLIEMCEEISSSGNGLKAIKTFVKGRVVYEEIPEIRDVDLNKYRKDSTTIWKIVIE